MVGGSVTFRTIVAGRPARIVAVSTVAASSALGGRACANTVTLPVTATSDATTAATACRVIRQAFSH
jgi:hypothetical protein